MDCDEAVTNSDQEDTFGLDLAHAKALSVEAVSASQLDEGSYMAFQWAVGLYTAYLQEGL